MRKAGDEVVANVIETGAGQRARCGENIGSAMTPLGIVAGASIGAVLTGRADGLFEATFDSLGAGTFVYIAALDIIRTEFDSPEDHAWKWVSAAVGFGLMALLAIWI